MDSIKVAVIEDDKTVNFSLKQAIEMQVMMDLRFTSFSVEEGLEKMVMENDINVLLLDIGLPGMNGIEGIKFIKEKIPTIDIIMLSSFDETDRIFAALCQGACSYISKKTSLKTIMDAIHTVSRGGSFMSPSIARKIADHFKPKRDKRFENLSERQMSIVKSLSNGDSYQEIADTNFISLNTVRFHIKKIYEILQINSKIQLIKMYRE